MLSKSSIYEFLAEPFHCDFTHHLFMGHLGNHLLNAADFHSNERGFGMKYLNTINRTWVLSRLAIEMNEMPCQYDRFNVETWVEGAMRYFTNRDFAVTGKDGKVFGYGKSIWAMIDTETRQPADLFDINGGTLKDCVMPEKTCPIDKPSRVKMSDKAELKRIIETNYSDVDVNSHINSVKYIEHVLDIFPLDWYKHHKIKRFEIAYVAESHYGDKLSFYQEKISEEEYNIEIRKSLPKSDELIEVCRSKVKFVND